MARKVARKKAEVTSDKVLEVVISKAEVEKGQSSPPAPNDIKVKVNGHSRWLTKGAIEVAIQRGQDVEIPKGSPYIPPPHLEGHENCKGCGKR